MNRLDGDHLNGGLSKGHKPCIGFLNICSLYNKQLFLLDLIRSYSVNIMCVNETWLSSDVRTSELFFDHFTVCCIDFNRTRSGLLTSISTWQCNDLEKQQCIKLIF